MCHSPAHDELTKARVRRVAARIPPNVCDNVADNAQMRQTAGRRITQQLQHAGRKTLECLDNERTSCPPTDPRQLRVQARLDRDLQARPVTTGVTGPERCTPALHSGPCRTGEHHDILLTFGDKAVYTHERNNTVSNTVRDDDEQAEEQEEEEGEEEVGVGGGAGGG